MSGDSSIGIGIGLALKSYGRAFRGLLNEYPGAAAAYSLRKLSGAVSNVVRVRRSSDDAEQDFTAAQVSDGTLVNFANNGTSDLYGERMWFDGVDDQVNLDSDTVLTPNSFVEVTATIPAAGNNVICGKPSNGEISISSSIATLRMNSGSAQTWDTSGLNAGAIYTFRFTWDNANSAELFIDSASQGSKFIASGNFTISAIGDGRFVSSRGSGLIYDVNINDEVSYLGYGNTDADWTDQIGSNDGTVSGSPALYSGQGFDGFVATWYDQSGNANDALQATTTAQPKIVDAGALVVGGLDFDGVDDFLLAPDGVVGIDSSFILSQSDSSAVQAVAGTNTAFNYYGLIVNATTFRFGQTGSLLDATVTSTSNEFLSTLLQSDGNVYLNGSLSASGTVNVDGDDLTIGARQAGSSAFWSGVITEAIFYPSDQSSTRTAIEGNINAHYNIYP